MTFAILRVVLWLKQVEKMSTYYPYIIGCDDYLNETMEEVLTSNSSNSCFVEGP